MKRRVGVVGAGQLARMMAQAAIPLDIELVLLAADASDGAAKVVPNVIVGSPDDPAALRALADVVDVMTFDHELVEPELLAALEADGVAIWPSAATMALAQNKRRQRAELGAAGFPVPAFANVDSLDDLLAFGAAHRWPVAVKASRGGYDGRGVWIVRDDVQARAVWNEAQEHGTILLVEEFLQLEREFAVIVARNPSGESIVYPVIETVQRNGVCNELHVPLVADNALLVGAQEIAERIAATIGAVGILAVEVFVADGRVLVNELAPRPHNSGHWSIEGAQTSQFEQHLRAVLDLPLGSTSLMGNAVATINILGPGDGSDPVSRLPGALAVEGAHVHFYGKSARPGRKLGHVTVVGSDAGDTLARAKSAAAILQGEPS
ncbi:MAG TPA: 5-(carboxyamino)imidazole ribonucleotide synthase [Thermomicrobiales bacterium]|nr:5-(carboxyamino)imidazole ribonucleotide synthase [Thermomicrobiales bacterium]